MPKRKSEFTEEIQKKYPCFRKGRNDFEAECIVCGYGTFISVANKGGLSLDMHVQSTKHKKAIRGETSSAKVTDYFCKPGTQTEDNVAAAEATMAFHTVKHHQSYKSNDCTSPLMRKLFPDSNISKKYSCARTKVEAIVNNVLSPMSVKYVLNDIQEHDIMYLGVATDSSNHQSTKLFPIVVQYFDWKHGGLQSKLLEVKSTTNETSLTIANKVKETLTKMGLFEKCVSFTGDNCNTNFGGLRRPKGNNVFSRLKNDLPTLVGVGCPAHILNNCLHHGTNQMTIDVESIMYKTYQYFYIYTVRTEELKDYCNFVDTEYRKLLSHSVTRWLSLYPSLSRMLQMFPALQSYFTSIDKPPIVLKRFYEAPLSELYLKHLQSFIAVFNKQVQNIERSKASIGEVRSCLDAVKSTIKERKKHMFISTQIKSKLNKLREEGQDQACDSFIRDVPVLYKSCVEYLDKWTSLFYEFECFDWMLLSQTTKWENVEPCLEYLQQKNVSIDEAKLFDQYHRLCKFIETQLGTNALPYRKMMAHERWAAYFNTCSTTELFSELLKIAQFYFSIIAHNANVERIFSLLQPQWSKERERFLFDSVASILKLVYNFNDVTCNQFYDIVKADSTLLKKVQETAKYSWAKSKN